MSITQHAAALLLVRISDRVLHRERVIRTCFAVRSAYRLARWPAISVWEANLSVSARDRECV